MLRSSETPTPQRAATVLVVDDEPPVLALVRRMLSRAGYTVLEASGGEEALRVAGSHQTAIQLLLGRPDARYERLATSWRKNAHLSSVF